MTNSVCDEFNCVSHSHLFLREFDPYLYPICMFHYAVSVASISDFRYSFIKRLSREKLKLTAPGVMDECYVSDLTVYSGAVFVPSFRCVV